SLSSAPTRCSTSVNTTLPTLPELRPDTYHLVLSGVDALVPSALSISADVLSALRIVEGADVDDEEDVVVDATVLPLEMLDAGVVTEGVGVGVGVGAGAGALGA